MVSKLNKETKLSFFNKFDVFNEPKPFWDTFKPYFSNKHSKGNSKILLIENNEILQKNEEVSDIFNRFFGKITKSLNLFDWPDLSYNNETDPINTIVKKYQNHPSISKIKQNYRHDVNFQFQPVSVSLVKKIIQSLPSNKSSGGEIPLRLLKNCGFTFNQLTECINECLHNNCFPDSLKLANVTPVFKKGDSTDKSNYRPISILPLLSKVFEKIIYDQLYEYSQTFLNKLLCGFRKAHSTQHALFRLLQAWQKELDNSGLVGTILMDLSKAYDCLPHDLLIAKLEAYGINRNSLKLILNYLSSRKQRVKVGSCYSSWFEILRGVPQGSILGPILFNIFINDIFLFVEKCEICNFADDNTIYSCNKSLQVIKDNLVHDMKILLKWYKLFT